MAMNRIINQMKDMQGSQGEESLVQRLTLYKTLATVRDTKEVFFYLQVNANVTTISPLYVFTNKDKFPLFDPTNNGGHSGAGHPAGITPYDVPPWFMPLGTCRTIQLREQFEHLLDLTVPKDKYLMELNLAEAQIEAQPGNWKKQRNYKLDKRLVFPDGWDVINTYDVEYNYAAAPPAGGRQPVEEVYFKESLRPSTPEPLFIRIKTMDNREPYNWSVVNNGAFNIDKSHGPVVIHDFQKYSCLDVEFGHLVFKGNDYKYSEIGKRDLTIDRPGRTATISEHLWENSPETNNTLQNPLDQSDRFEFLDYNWEWENQPVPSDENVARGGNSDNKYITPDVRGTYIRADQQQYDDALPALPILPLTTKPLKENQQAANITMRWVIRLHHLF